MYVLLSFSACWNFNPRSPCGERLAAIRKKPQISNFNPRSPCGERRASPFADEESPEEFQSALPLRGATRRVRRARDPDPMISIRAPLAGSDCPRFCECPRTEYFNPRSPCGERHGVRTTPTAIRNFNPRSPCGERRPKLGTEGGSMLFQSALPLRGATERIPTPVHD